MVTDQAAQIKLTWKQGTHRERAAAEAEWRANRRIESDVPKGDTVLPRGWSIRGHAARVSPHCPLAVPRLCLISIASPVL